MKYFIDCGSHFFQGLKEFNRKYRFDKSWTIYSFEANPRTYAKSKTFINEGLENLNIIHQNLAVSTSDGEIVVNCDVNNDGGTGAGSNILTVPPVADIVHKHVFTWDKERVKKINLSNFLIDLEDVERLIVKLDIEGSEFDVLNQIINDCSYIKVEKFYIEFHERFFIEEIESYTEIKNKIINFFVDKKINIDTWS